MPVRTSAASELSLANGHVMLLFAAACVVDDCDCDGDGDVRRDNDTYCGAGTARRTCLRATVSSCSCTTKAMEALACEPFERAFGVNKGAKRKAKKEIRERR
jgi:hypothetical protein